MSSMASATAANIEHGADEIADHVMKEPVAANPKDEELRRIRLSAASSQVEADGANFADL